MPQQGHPAPDTNPADLSKPPRGPAPGEVALRTTPEELADQQLGDLKARFREQSEGKITLLEVALGEPDPMPEFVIKGKDLFALSAIEYYRKQCVLHGLIDQAREVDNALQEMAAWRLRNPELVKIPDHVHVPAR